MAAESGAAQAHANNHSQERRLNTFSPARDLTHKQPAAGVGMSVQLLFMCGTAKEPHKGGRTGALMRGKIPLRCPACVAKGKA